MCESGTECHISRALTPAVAGLTIMEKPSSHYKLLWQDCSTCVQHTKKSRDWLWQISITLHVSCSVFLEDSLTNGLYAEFWWTMVRLFGVSICCSECINGKWLCETRRKGLWTQFILIVSSQSFSAESKALASAGSFLEQRARSTWLQIKKSVNPVTFWDGQPTNCISLKKAEDPLHSLRTSKKIEADGSTENRMSPKPITSTRTKNKDEVYRTEKTHTKITVQKSLWDSRCFEFYVYLKITTKKY